MNIFSKWVYAAGATALAPISAAAAWACARAGIKGDYRGNANKHAPKYVADGASSHRLRLVSALGALLAALPALAADPPQCNLLQIAEWPVRLERGLPVIEG